MIAGRVLPEKVEIIYNIRVSLCRSVLLCRSFADSVNLTAMGSKIFWTGKTIA